MTSLYLVIYRTNTGIRRFVWWCPGCWRGGGTQQNLDLQPHEGIGFPLFPIRLLQRHRGAGLPTAQGSAAASASAEQLWVTQMHAVTAKRHRCPLLSSWQQGSQTGKLTYETGWLWAVRDVELDHGKKYSRHVLYWNTILFTYSTFRRRHSCMPKMFYLYHQTSR